MKHLFHLKLEKAANSTKGPPFCWAIRCYKTRDYWSLEFMYNYVKKPLLSFTKKDANALFPCYVSGVDETIARCGM